MSATSNELPIITDAVLFFSRPMRERILKYCDISMMTAKINRYNDRCFILSVNILMKVYIKITTRTSPIYGLMILS